ncbi:transposase [Infirmifilum lucidum]|uniref:Transposase n=1 Tax=Infirmifilum lucidum TaxID=2776706 RepID=A0A7L9FI34_9CREN|nr:RNA-guided endonuclease TnpB family protein [Infirmifilum lucidum]QOJ79311.1 transposase [Infirmifilum lucidum]
MRRTSVVRLLPNKGEEGKLKLLCSLSARLWNEVNYERRRQFFSKKGVDMRGTYKTYYEKYKVLIGSATAQQVLNKNDEAWRSFFASLRKKKTGGLPRHITKVDPPGYMKDGGRRKLWAVLRNDQYKIEGDKLILKGLGAIGRLEVEYRGEIHLRGEQGRLEIINVDGAWYAHISFEAEEKAVRGAWREVPGTPRGGLRAGVDVGINNLLAVYVEDGRTALYSGRPLKAIAFYYRRKIADYQSTLNGSRTSKRLRRLYRKWLRKARHFINTQVRRAIEWLYEGGVSTIYVGYPKEIARNNGNFYTVNLWHYGYLLKRVVEVAEEYGINAVLVPEEGTSKRCPIHGEGCGIRIKRGLFKCTKSGIVFNADLVGAYNIMAKSIAPSPAGDRGNGPDTRPGAEPDGNVAPNLPALAGTLAL